MGSQQMTDAMVSRYDDLGCTFFLCGNESLLLMCEGFRQAFLLFIDFLEDLVPMAEKLPWLSESSVW